MNKTICDAVSINQDEWEISGDQIGQVWTICAPQGSIEKLAKAIDQFMDEQDSDLDNAQINVCGRSGQKIGSITTRLGMVSVWRYCN